MNKDTWNPRLKTSYTFSCLDPILNVAGYGLAVHKMLYTQMHDNNAITMTALKVACCVVVCCKLSKTCTWQKGLLLEAISNPSYGVHMLFGILHVTI